MQAKSQVRLVISHLAEALHSVVGEIHGFWTWIPLALLQMLLQARLIVGCGEGFKLLVLG